MSDLSKCGEACNCAECNPDKTLYSTVDEPVAPTDELVKLITEFEEAVNDREYANSDLNSAPYYVDPTEAANKVAVAKAALIQFYVSRGI